VKDEFSAEAEVGNGWEAGFVEKAPKDFFSEPLRNIWDVLYEISRCWCQAKQPKI